MTLYRFVYYIVYISGICVGWDCSALTENNKNKLIPIWLSFEPSIIFHTVRFHVLGKSHHISKNERNRRVSAHPSLSNLTFIRATLCHSAYPAAVLSNFG